MKKISIFLICVTFFGCASVSSKTQPPAPSVSPVGQEYLPAEKAVPALEEISTLETTVPGVEEPLEEIVVIPKGTVFAKTVFSGVVKASYVRLTIVDQQDSEKTYQLVIGDKERQKSFPWKIQTVSPGYFFIDLPVGSYMMNMITIPVGSTLASEPMAISFDVTLDTTTYLGTLKVTGEKERIKLGGVPIIRPGFEYAVEVLDERLEADEELKNRFPDFDGILIYQLMAVHLSNNSKEAVADSSAQ